jgi:hypothetical protein
MASKRGVKKAADAKAAKEVAAERRNNFFNQRKSPPVNVNDDGTPNTTRAAETEASATAANVDSTQMLLKWILTMAAKKR